MNVNVSDQQGNTLVKRLWLNEEQSALCAPSVSPILIQKGFKSSKGDFRANNSRVFLLCSSKQNTPASVCTNGGWHTELAYETCKNSALDCTSTKLVSWSTTSFRATHPPKSKFCNP